MRCIYQTVNPARSHTVRVMSPNAFGEYAVRVAEFTASGIQAILPCAGTYFTNDREDAIATAHHIAQRFAHLRLWHGRTDRPEPVKGFPPMR